MVKVGFICEGYTESILLLSDSFKQLLTSLNIERLNVINAKGCDNLLPHNIGGYVTSLEKVGANVIVILTDLDDDICITQTKVRINARAQDIVIIAVKTIESWFLASTSTMRAFLGLPGFQFADPENEINPFETINNLLITHSGRGIGRLNAGKIRLINRLINYGLDISQAATHPNCPSAAYFLKKLMEIGAKNDLVK
jgi:hypothetical protein